MTPCPFCDTGDRERIAENGLAFAIYDGYPVSEGHALVIPHRHVPSIFDLNDQEYDGCFRLVRDVHAKLVEMHGTDAFNVGINTGEVAGQTVPHAHIHLIPRYPGDVDDPRGGVRHVIPGKGFY